MRFSHHVLQIAIVIQQVGELVGQQGEWTSWGPWSSCSVTCGYGTQERQRTWKGPGGNNQEITYSDIIECITNRPCPIDGAWGFWGPWSECTHMCDGGTTTRKRECNAPEPQNDGSPCEGKSSATTSCNDWLCPELPADFDISQCNETTFMCLSKKQCIPEENRCDDTLQCHDGSDEHNCYFYHWNNAAGTITSTVLQLFWTTVFTIILFATTS